jgi:hypothetical protein
VNVLGSSGTGVRGDEQAATSPFGVDAPANVLLFGPSMGGDGKAVDQLLDTAAGNPALLTVSLLRPPQERLARWEQRWETPPAEVATIGCKSTAGTTSAQQPEVPFRSTSVADPGELTGLGIRTGECLDAWEDRSIVVTVDSITTMLQYADTKRVFQFLHVLTSRLKRAGALAGFHMDPSAHDEQTVATVKSLFDEVYRRVEDDWERVG